MPNDDDLHANVQALALQLGFTPIVPRHPDHDAIERYGRLLEILDLSPADEYYVLERRAKRITKEEFRASGDRLMTMLKADRRAETRDPAVPDATHDAYVALLARVKATPEWAALVARRTSGALDDRTCLDVWYALIDATTMQNPQEKQ